MYRPLIFGEVLIDEFPDGRKCLGGAPFNVACHLKAFGGNPIFISRIGSDPNGTMILERMRELDLDSSGIEVDDSRPTGRVTVELAAGSPSFQILPNQAYDFIGAGGPLSLVDRLRSDLAYAGTLAARSEVSRKTLTKILERSGAALFLDLNLRPPWIRSELIEVLVARASWLKVNQAELAYLVGSSEVTLDRVEKAGRSLFSSSSSLQLLIVTCGEKGAFLIDRDQALFQEPGRDLVIADSVGAGDAFSAVVMDGLLRKKPPLEILKKAVTFSGWVCTYRGALPQDAGFYQSFRQAFPRFDWEGEGGPT